MSSRGRDDTSSSVTTNGAKDERARVADIQEDYLKRSFASILLRHQETLFDLDEEVTRGAGGAEGRLRKAELSKAQVEAKKAKRLEETRRGRNVRRGQVRVLATARLLPASIDQMAARTPGDTKHSNAEIEQIAVADGNPLRAGSPRCRLREVGRE